MKQYWLAGMLVMAVAASATASPLESARQRARESFSQTRPIAVDPAVIQAPWQASPFDSAPFTFTFEQIHQQWPQLMRGLRLPYPSPAFLKARYRHYPALYRDLHYQDTDWQAHSDNTLEVWQAFFRGDFRHARDLGRHYGGYARVPGLLSQIIYATYLEPSHTGKQQLLQQAVNDIARLGKKMQVLPSEEERRSDYCMLRLGFSYAVARLAEDASVATTLASNYAPMVSNAAAEILAVEPSHPLALALGAAFEANVVRRVGKAAGRLVMAADEQGATRPFQQALSEHPDLAIVHYEYANSLIYTHGVKGRKQARKHLRLAMATEPRFSMEWLDRAYAAKRLEEINAWAEADVSFGRFDRKRRRFMKENNANLYSVTAGPFLID